jgi:TolA-binding protein
VLEGLAAWCRSGGECEQVKKDNERLEDENKQQKLQNSELYVNRKFLDQISELESRLDQANDPVEEVDRLEDYLKQNVERIKTLKIHQAQLEQRCKAVENLTTRHTSIITLSLGEYSQTFLSPK